MDVGEQVLELVDNQQQAVTGLKLRKTTLMFTRHMRQTSILNAYEQPRKVLSRSGTLGEFFVFTADQSVGAPVERADEGNQALTQDALGQRMDELGATVESGGLSAHRDQGGGLVVGTRGDYQADNATLLPIPGIGTDKATLDQAPLDVESVTVAKSSTVPLLLHRRYGSLSRHS